MKKLLFSVLSLSASMVFAEMKLNPDPNTLWIEDGKNIQTATNNYSYGFNNTDLIVTPNPAGGFYMEQKQQGKPRSGRKVKATRDIFVKQNGHGFEFTAQNQRNTVVGHYHSQ